ncbi:MAG: hypothetical protein GX361_07515 [Bacteroidales bacterium]|nr:hypothetical protein [Bacteroidales bacterium]
MKTLTSKHLILFAAIILSSCATPRMFTTLDLLRPAEVTFEPGVKNVLVVNNSVVQPNNKKQKSANDKNSGTLTFDSTALFCNASLRESLEAKEFFNTVKMAPNSQNTTDNYNKISPLDKKKVKALCDLYDVDALISLDHIQANDETSKYYEDYTIMNALDIKVNTIWSIHYPNNTATTHKQFTDEFSWEEAKSVDLPKKHDALVDACILTGSNVAERMIPRWEKQDRYFFTPKKPLMQQAMDSVKTRNWQSAISLWKHALKQSKNFNTKFQASNNIAIAYEILGDIDNAFLYCEQAINYYPYVMFFYISDSEHIYEILNYYDFLKKRKEEIALISKQLSEK